jgi:type IX secretion system PorP/SprF family membrane protein
LKFTGLNVIIFALVSQFILSNSIHAQDIHFSQFYTTTVLNNPANAGISDNDIRIATNYRNQWANISQPFNTYYFSVDKRQYISNQQFGFGISAVNDQSSGGLLQANKFYFSISYTKFINNNQFVFGIQPGLVFKSLGSQSMTYGTQFNPITNKFDSSLPSNEKGLNDNSNYFDFNVGILWRSSIKNTMPLVGFSIGHINKPTETFFNLGKQPSLALKYIFNAQIKIPILVSYDITPCILTSYIPGTREMVAGAIGGYNIEKFIIPVKRIYATNLYRINPLRNIDAVIVGGGVCFANFDIGITYDLTVSSLHKANQFRGAFEISLQYNGALRQKQITEPCHIY